MQDDPFSDIFDEDGNVIEADSDIEIVEGEPIEHGAISGLLDPWAFYDFTMGLAVGSYGPLAKRGRDGDCFSKNFSLLTGLITYSKYFDKEFKGGWFDYTYMIAGIGIDGYNIYSATKTCAKQLDFSKADPWLDRFANYAAELAEEDEEDEEHDGDVEWDWISDTLSMIGIAKSSYGIYKSLKSEFYYYDLGKNIGAAFFKTFTWVDYFFELGMIEPTKPWDRYPIV